MPAYCQRTEILYRHTNDRILECQRRKNSTQEKLYATDGCRLSSVEGLPNEWPQGAKVRGSAVHTRIGATVNSDGGLSLKES
jgi:hypothetical protein